MSDEWDDYLENGPISLGDDLLGDEEPAYTWPFGTFDPEEWMEEDYE